MDWCIYIFPKVFEKSKRSLLKGFHVIGEYLDVDKIGNKIRCWRLLEKELYDLTEFCNYDNKQNMFNFKIDLNIVKEFEQNNLNNVIWKNLNTDINSLITEGFDTLYIKIPESELESLINVLFYLIENGLTEPTLKDHIEQITLKSQFELHNKISKTNINFNDTISFKFTNVKVEHKLIEFDLVDEFSYGLTDEFEQVYLIEVLKPFWKK